MIISHQYGFVFVKTRKTAGTSIEWYLNRFLGPEDVATPVHPPLPGYVARNYDGVFNPLPEVGKGGLRAIPKATRDVLGRRRFYNHLPGYAIRARTGTVVWDDYLTFCVERNPWDKTVSYYSMINARSSASITWEEFLAGDDHCNDIRHYVEPKDHSAIIVDRVIRFETLNTELTALFSDLGIPFDGTLTQRAKSEYRTDERDYREWYDDDQRRRIADVFADEIKLHGYSFG